ncbi:hypothetical protein WG926_17425 [Tistrella sp. BH-R2-4]|uniref:Uncharacterized protein n=1 Tax=Tistrella arctica TaxID=3133430 RepID=A0ABU9YMR9_9PROT
MGVASSLIHPMRYMRTRPFAKPVIQTYVRKAGRTLLPTMADVERIQNVVFPAYNDAISVLPFEKRPERPTAMLVQECSLALHVGMYTAFGRNAYLLSPRLVDLLDRTDLGAVRVRDIKLPFRAFYLSFGDAFDARLPGPPNRIDGAYVSLSGTDSLQIVVTTCRLDAGTSSAAYWPFSRDLYYYAPLDIADINRSFEQILDDAIGTEIKLEADITEPDPDLVAERPDGHEVLIQDVRYLSQAEWAEYARDGLPAFRRALALIVNAMCYMTAEPQDTALDYPDDAPSELVKAVRTGKPSQRNRAKIQMLDRGFSFIRVIGSALSVRDLQTGTTGDGVGTLRPHWRRGHWRRQPHGLGRSEIRLVWIRPTLVGASAGESEAGHIYLIE